jgi:hypothetical protein
LDVAQLTEAEGLKIVVMVMMVIMVVAFGSSQACQILAVTLDNFAHVSVPAVTARAATANESPLILEVEYLKVFKCYLDFQTTIEEIHLLMYYFKSRMSG